ncbi:MAG: hypothetical protein C0510_02885 [Erythrobacter sp.]|nr:hypothetical protein [Erythrobacter sp.]
MRYASCRTGAILVKQDRKALWCEAVKALNDYVQIAFSPDGTDGMRATGQLVIEVMQPNFWSYQSCFKLGIDIEDQIVSAHWEN